MATRPVLIIHGDSRRRFELRRLLPQREVLEADCRESAVPLLARGALSLVLAQPHGFRRLLRDLERQTPGTPRAVLCPDDPEVRRELFDLASEGYDFVTIPESAPETVRQLVEPRGARRVRPQAGLTAHFLAGSVDFLATVAEVSSDGLGLWLPPRAPVERLAVGTALEHATVSGAQGVLLEPRRWVVRTLRRVPGRSGEVHLGVSIEPSADEASRRAATALHDPIRVRGLLRRALARRAPFVLHLAEGTGRWEYEAGALDAADRLVLERPRTGARFEPGEVVTLAFELLGSQVEALTTVLEVNGGACVLALPRAARRRERREALRVRLDGEPRGVVTLLEPLSGQTLERPLFDLHPMGASFELDDDAIALPPSLVLPRVTLQLGDTTFACSAVVQGSLPLTADGSRRRVGLRLVPLPGDERQGLIDAWLTRLVPDVRCGARVTFDAIWRLFQHEQVRFPDYPLEAPATQEALAATHRAVGDGRHGLGKAFVFTDGDQVLGHASGLRTHSRSWLAQHLVVRSGYHRGTQISQALVNLSFDYAEALGDVDYLRGLWRTSNRWPSRVFGTVTAKLLRPGQSHLTSFTPMRRAVGPVALPPGVAARPARDEDLADLVEHLRATFDPVFLQGHDLTKDQLQLESLAPRYRAAGLDRHRRFGVALRDGRPAGWAVLERMTPGLFWAEWYNAFRLFVAEPGAPDADAVRAALVAWAMQALSDEGARVAECIAGDEDREAVSRLGFTDLGRVMEYTAHRSLTRDITAQVVAVFEKLTARERRGTGEDRGA